MERNWDAIRALLVGLEGEAGESLSCKSVDDPIKAYNLIILADGGYVVLGDVIDLGENHYAVIPIRMTWEGHELLDSIREERVFRGVMSKIKDVAKSVPVEIVKKLAVDLILAQI
jgi:hypothetical protein